MAAWTNNSRRPGRAAHALPSKGLSMFRRAPVARSRHAARGRPKRIGDEAPKRLQQRIIRVISARAGAIAHWMHAADSPAYPVPDLNSHFLPADPRARLWDAPLGSTQVFRASMIGCTAIVVFFGLAEFSHPVGAPAPHAGHNSARAALPSAHAPSPGPQPSSSGISDSFLKPAGAAQIDLGAPPADMYPKTPATATPDLAQLVGGLAPPERDDPDLVSALAELDATAERDESIRQQQLAGEVPPEPARTLPTAPPDPQSAPALGSSENSPAGPGGQPVESPPGPSN